MGRSDEFDEFILQNFASGKDPPKDPPEGKFIKEYTDKIIRYGWSDRTARENICYNINSGRPVDLAFTWRNTKQ